MSLIPIVLDCMKEWVAHSEKLPRNMIQSVSGKHTGPERQATEAYGQCAAEAGLSVAGQPTFRSTATQTSVSLIGPAQKSRRGQKKLQVGLGRAVAKLLDGPWKPPGRHAF